MLSLASSRQPAADADRTDAVGRVPGDAASSMHDTAPATMRRDDWEALLRAVTERLHWSVEDLARTDGDDRLRPGVELVEPLRECVAALGQLLRELEPHAFEAPTPLHPPGPPGTRAEFEQQLARSLAAATRGAPAPSVLCLGLDGFGRINDQYGREVGDAALNIVGRRLAHALRAQDLVCRLDGDKFACMLDARIDRAQLGRFACRLFDAVAAPLCAGAVTFSVLPRIGIATGPADGDTGELLLRHADAALGCAQRRQQGYVFFEPRSDL